MSNELGWVLCIIAYIITSTICTYSILKYAYTKSTYGEKDRIKKDMLIVIAVSAILVVVANTVSDRNIATTILITTLIYASYTDIKETSVYNVQTLICVMVTIHEFIVSMYKGKMSIATMVSIVTIAAVVEMIVAITKIGAIDAVIMIMLSLHLAINYGGTVAGEDAVKGAAVLMLMASCIFLMYKAVFKRGQKKCEFIPSLALAFVVTTIIMSRLNV